MASSKGSFRTAYNTNKLLSVSPLKDMASGLLSGLKLKCEANRERESINIMLEVDNTIIRKVEDDEPAYIQ